MGHDDELVFRRTVLRQPLNILDIGFDFRPPGTAGKLHSNIPLGDKDLDLRSVLYASTDIASPQADLYIARVFQQDLAPREFDFHMVHLSNHDLAGLEDHEYGNTLRDLKADIYAARQNPLAAALQDKGTVFDTMGERQGSLSSSNGSLDSKALARLDDDIT